MSDAATSPSRDQLVAAGRDAVLAGDHARARELLDSAVRLDPGDAEAWVWLGGAHTDPAAMVACLNRALQLDPGLHQAREGLRWVAETFGDDVAYGRPGPAASPTLPLRVAGSTSLAQAAVYPFTAGALLGLVRLVGWLRPETLLELRPGAPAVSLGGALLVALVAAVAHGAALLVAWAMFGATLGTLQPPKRRAIGESLRHAGRVFEPGLVWGVALLLAVFGLVFTPAVWPAVGVLCLLVLVAGAVLIVARINGLFRALDVAPRVGLPAAAACFVVALLGLWLAGLVSAAAL